MDTSKPEVSIELRLLRALAWADRAAAAGRVQGRTFGGGSGRPQWIFGIGGSQCFMVDAAVFCCMAEGPWLRRSIGAFRPFSDVCAALFERLKLGGYGQFATVSVGTELLPRLR